MKDFTFHLKMHFSYDRLLTCHLFGVSIIVLKLSEFVFSHHQTTYKLRSLMGVLINILVDHYEK